MKMTQAYAWLAAGVLAAGLNASYHDGGLQRVHEIVDRVEQHSAAVLTLASENTDRFLSEVRWMTAREQTASCPLSRLARAESRLAESQVARVETRMTQARFDRFEAMAERQRARMEANRARIEAQTTRMRISAMASKPMMFSAPVVHPNVECPRVRVSMPRLPRIQVPEIPVVHVETASAGPV